jgi:DNA ligase-1
MQRFTQLYVDLDRTNRTAEKVAVLVDYFRAAPPEDAAWALYFLMGNKPPRAVNTRLLREWMAEFTGLAPWLIDECYDAVGDLGETLALLIPPAHESFDQPLAAFVRERVLGLRAMTPEAQRAMLFQSWRELSQPQALVWHKLITGQFRVGVARTLVVRALAEVAGVEAPTMSHRVMGDWTPSAATFVQLISPEMALSGPGQPYPFQLAHPLEGTPEELGPVEDWQLEWKWDGIRAQLIRRAGEMLVWSRGEELVTDRFPELHDIGRVVADGTVLDGEVLAWREEQVLPFAVLQRRIGRKRLSGNILTEAPVVFLAYDVLEHAGRDIRALPQHERRALLEQIYHSVGNDTRLRLSPLVEVDSWDEVRERYAAARERNVEGLMLKRKAAPYGVGRVRNDWWKWKVQPYTIDAVLIYAQKGNGRRASLFSDYTFGVWHDGQLVPMAKAYSGLTDVEIKEVDAFVRRHTTERFGPVRVVEPKLVFELHFEGIAASTRHKAGISVRFPRMGRWRRDKQPEDADTLETLRRMLNVATDTLQGAK